MEYAITSASSYLSQQNHSLHLYKPSNNQTREYLHKTRRKKKDLDEDHSPGGGKKYFCTFARGSLLLSLQLNDSPSAFEDSHGGGSKGETEERRKKIVQDAPQFPPVSVSPRALAFTL